MRRGRAWALVIVAAVLVVAVAAIIIIARGSGSPAPARHRGFGPVAEPRSAPQVPAHGAYIGAWVRPQVYTAAGETLAVGSLEAQLGRRLDIVHRYLTWTAPFPVASDFAAARQGSTLLLSWTGNVSQSVAAGGFDQVIRQRARQIKAFGRPVFLQWRWEMDRPNLRGVVGPPAEFIAAWKHVRAIFRQQHVRNVAWVWCPTAKGFGPGGDAAAYYPGDAQVDWICADAYPGFGPYRTFSRTVQPFLRWAAHHRKPVMIGEYGVPESYPPAQRAAWLRAAAQTARSHPQIKAMVYFDSSPTASVPADSFALAQDTPPLQAFRVIADSPYFNPDRVKVKR